MGEWEYLNNNEFQKELSKRPELEQGKFNYYDNRWSNYMLSKQLARRYQQESGWENVWHVARVVDMYVAKKKKQDGNNFDIH